MADIKKLYEAKERPAEWRQATPKEMRDLQSDIYHRWGERSSESGWLILDAVPDDIKAIDGSIEKIASSPSQHFACLVPADSDYVGYEWKSWNEFPETMDQVLMPLRPDEHLGEEE